MHSYQWMAHVSTDELQAGDVGSGFVSMDQSMASNEWATYLPDILVVLSASVSQPGEADDGATSEDACS